MTDELARLLAELKQLSPSARLHVAADLANTRPLVAIAIARFAANELERAVLMPGAQQVGP